jgi:membrane-associated protease RseP (regulator of RpoE activity)
MKKNVGGVDRTIRIVAGAALIAWVLFASGPAWAWIGIVPLATGLFNFCPAYSLLGINSCKTK